jgi:ribosomal protein S18 acetylase RimI-like enzyme
MGERRWGEGSLLLAAAYQGGRIVATAAAQRVPGAVALGVVPAAHDRGDRAEALQRAHAAIPVLARAHGTQLLQYLLSEDTQSFARILQAAGLRYLTRLLYLERPLEAPVPPPRSDSGLSLIPVDRIPRTELVRALQATYLDTRDCPELTGTRSIDAVIEGHQAAGTYLPELWWVALRGEEPVGVLFLSKMENREALEVVYLGVAQPARKSGVASALLTKAQSLAREHQAKRLSLAVDSSNLPGRALYERWGFLTMYARDVWYLTLKPQ